MRSEDAWREKRKTGKDAYKLAPLKDQVEIEIHSKHT